MEVILVARSIGRRSATDPLSTDGHAALVFNLAPSGSSDHWLAQAGPSPSGLLLGRLTHCSSAGWYAAFSTCQVNWTGPPQTMNLPVVVLSRFQEPKQASRRLEAIADRLNARHLRYVYDPGPNSNTYVSLFLEQIGHPIGASPTCPSPLAGPLKGWSWRG